MLMLARVGVAQAVWERRLRRLLGLFPWFAASGQVFLRRKMFARPELHNGKTITKHLA